MAIEVKQWFGGYSLLLGVILSAYAGSDVPKTVFPTAPGISLSGYGGNGWTGSGDALIPGWGIPQNFIYLDPQINYHSQGEYFASLGLGQRWMAANSIWGAYLFGDYNRSSSGQDFWFVSPGLERLGQIWDFSFNTYLPVSQQRVTTGTEFADQAGDFSQIHFTGHDQYDELVNTIESTGWGSDAKISAHIMAQKHHYFWI